MAVTNTKVKVETLSPEVFGSSLGPVSYTHLTLPTN